MDWTETGIHTFVLRIWLEESRSETDAAVWRGKITHYPGDEYRYVGSIAEIMDFLIPYLEGMDAPAERPRRGPPGWLQRLRRLKAGRVARHSSHRTIPESIRTRRFTPEERGR